MHDVIVVGAGIAGLSLARELREEGHDVRVLERARGVGGRCATRRIDDQPVDHGLPYLHGRSETFHAALAGVVSARAREGWPVAVAGTGMPCRPEAFEESDRRVTFAEGVSLFPKHLARGAEVRLNAEVASIELVPASAGAAERWRLRCANGETFEARGVALTMPAPAAARMLRATPGLPEDVAALAPLLDMVRTVPCLTVIARYRDRAPAPAWEASFPREGSALHSILHDSSKRAEGAPLTLVLQARPAWSGRRMDDPADAWTRALLDEAAALHGAWIASPRTVQSHRWRMARVVAGTELATPLLAVAAGGAAIGVAGDGLHAAGGAEGAYHSGRVLASRLHAVLAGRTTA